MASAGQIWRSSTRPVRDVFPHISLIVSISLEQDVWRNRWDGEWIMWNALNIVSPSRVSCTGTVRILSFLLLKPFVVLSFCGAKTKNFFKTTKRQNETLGNNKTTKSTLQRYNKNDKTTKPTTKRQNPAFVVLSFCHFVVQQRKNIKNVCQKTWTTFCGLFQLLPFADNWVQRFEIDGSHSFSQSCWFSSNIHVLNN